MKTELLKHPEILKVTTSSEVLGSLEEMAVFAVENRDGVVEPSTINVTQVDRDFFEAMDVKIIKGRDFNQRLLTDTNNSIIVNESMIKSMGWDDAIGKLVVDGRVIGVVEDFHFQSLHKVVDPIAIKLFSNDWSRVSSGQSVFMQRYMTIKISGENVRQTLSFLENHFAEFDPKHPFEYKFLDDSLNDLYQTEEQLLRLISIFAGLCIFIACLGLFGLSSYTTEQRSKEISIRKILGASAPQIIFTLSSSVLKLALIAGFFASVISYWVIDLWLQNFAFRIEMNGSAMFIAIITVMFIAYVTVALQSFKTAMADPVDALRHE